MWLIVCHARRSTLAVATITRVCEGIINSTGAVSPRIACGHTIPLQRSHATKRSQVYQRKSEIDTIRP